MGFLCELLWAKASGLSFGISVTLPTKNHFKDKSDINLIKAGLKQLYDFINHHDECAFDKIYCPLLGCGLGGLNWQFVSAEIWLDFLKFNGRLVFVSNA